MALDFQQVYAKIKEIGRTIQQRKEVLDKRREQARVLMNIYADALGTLRHKVEDAKEADPNTRCALPVADRLNARVAPPPLPQRATLIAADGSQINPDRHNAIQYGLINVGAIVMELNSGSAPEIHTDSVLLYDEGLYTASGNMMTDGMVALDRDLKERAKLEELATQRAGDVPVITFTDGPIELWGAREGEEAEAYFDSLRKYQGVLSKLQERGVVTAGYVDKPGADLVVRLLELVEATPEQMKALKAHHPLRGVTDRWLFGEKKDPLLKPGERSAVFAIQSKSEKQYKGGLALHFFYLNAGTEGHPWPVRVEIPKWVADDAEKLGVLHAVLVEQCRMMGARPYPYLLHRAHEVAVVKQEEKYQVEQMLRQEVQRNNGELDEGSNKQSAKDRGGRSAYKR